MDTGEKEQLGLVDIGKKEQHGSVDTREKGQLVSQMKEL